MERSSAALRQNSTRNNAGIEEEVENDKFPQDAGSQGTTVPIDEAVKTMRNDTRTGEEKESDPRTLIIPMLIADKTVHKTEGRTATRIAGADVAALVDENTVVHQTDTTDSTNRETRLVWNSPPCPHSETSKHIMTR